MMKPLFVSGFAFFISTWGSLAQGPILLRDETGRLVLPRIRCLEGQVYLFSRRGRALAGFTLDGEKMFAASLDGSIPVLTSDALFPRDFTVLDDGAILLAGTGVEEGGGAAFPYLLELDERGRYRRWSRIGDPGDVPVAPLRLAAGPGGQVYLLALAAGGESGERSALVLQVSRTGEVLARSRGIVQARGEEAAVSTLPLSTSPFCVDPWGVAWLQAEPGILIGVQPGRAIRKLELPSSREALQLVDLVSTSLGAVASVVEGENAASEQERRLGVTRIHQPRYRFYLIRPPGSPLQEIHPAHPVPPLVGELPDGRFVFAMGRGSGGARLEVESDWTLEPVVH